MSTQNLKDRFLVFAETGCRGNSELYYHLCLRIADDQQLLNIAAHSKEGQPVPNIFLAAIHYLLLKNPGATLAAYYPSIHSKHPEGIPFHLFKEFCLENRNKITEIITTKIVQTNVINRCSYLMPIFSKIIFDEKKPTTIIDIGTSAGLTLNFDQYEYWYDNQKISGKSKVMVRSVLIDSAVPQIYNISQPIVKIGLDQHIIDPTDPDEKLWLKALVWPDQPERFTAMEEALKLDELQDIKFVSANCITDFEKEIQKVDKSQNLIIYATHVLYQFSNILLDQFYAMLDRIGQTRDFYFLSAEGTKTMSEKYHSKDAVVEITQYKGSRKTVTFVAETDGHGNRIKWQPLSVAI